MACPGSCPSSHGKRHPDPKSGWEIEPDKLGCIIPCQGDETNPKVLRIFFVFALGTQILQPTLES